MVIFALFSGSNFFNFFLSYERTCLILNVLPGKSRRISADILLDFPGRTFKIKQVLSYDKKKLKKLLPENKANITIRNFPKTVAQIRKETKIKEGGTVFIFFTTNFKNELIVLICHKII